MKRVTLSRQQLLEQSEVLKDVIREGGIRVAVAKAHIGPGENGIEAVFMIEDWSSGTEGAAHVHIAEAGGVIDVIPVFVDSRPFAERVRALIKKVGLGEWLR